MISIIIPAHNEEKYILKTINSIKKQKFKKYEIIVVLDGCTDKTLSKIKGKVNKIINLKKRNGPGIAKNEGAKKAKGEILVFLDADTYMAEGLLELIYNKRNEYRVGTALMRPSNDKFKHKFFMWMKNKIVTPKGVSNGIIFCKKKIFEKVKGFPNVKKGEDGQFIFKVLGCKRSIKDMIFKNKKFFVAQNYVISSTRRFDELIT